ncbi:hypothetical protein BSZ39_03855 [Bowdeniella nasicola]|uniref:Uncharacterized protein n=1 Tax=Bowdeniella nasicola TaxID=208480 RepID=A0A1Q5Q3Y6_9ACTO|nr:hypothetical protein [Bowdeniella nasicola]OKL54515.1 hypothetical protein BSZ39_03855 [Bowdeniella nasicola]
MDVTVEYYSSGELKDSRTETPILGEPGDQVTVVNILVLPYRPYDVDDIKVTIAVKPSPVTNPVDKNIQRFERISTTTFKPDNSTSQFVDFDVSNPDPERPSSMQLLSYACKNAEGTFVVSAAAAFSQALEPGGAFTEEAPVPDPNELSVCEGTIIHNYVPDIPTP